MTDLATACRRLDGRSYPAYRDLLGGWRVGDLELHLDRIQGDPYAAPSRLHLQLDTGIPRDWIADREGRLAAEDALLRRFSDALRRGSSGRSGSGRSGQIACYHPGPEVCERSAVRLRADGRVTVRFTVGLPARGRRILGREAAILLSEGIPEIAEVLKLRADPLLEAHILSIRRQQDLRRALKPLGLVGFIANGSVLPRADGISTAPLPHAVPFRSPASLEIALPTRFGEVTGMGVPRGVTVLTGGGFHGKSTVLQALQRGHLDHIPGDGREGVVSSPNTVKVRAEDGRFVEQVDISDFLSELPGGRSTRPFSTPDASGSTSQAASILEALEAGADLLLLDEDTSATNLLVRDARMAALVPPEREPITPFLHRVRQLAEKGLSTVIVVGGVADYLGVADRVIAMTDWRPSDITERAHEVVPERPSAPTPLAHPGGRTPRSMRIERVRSRDTRAVELDKVEIDLTAVEHVLDGAHAATIGHAIRFLLELTNGERSLPVLLDALDAILDDEGVEALSPWEEPGGTLVRPRRHEIAAALNRYRRLEIRCPRSRPVS